MRFPPTLCSSRVHPKPSASTCLCSCARPAEPSTFPSPLPTDCTYRAYSFIEYEDAPVVIPPGKLETSDREELIRLPPNTDPRVAALARSMAGDATSDDAKARAIEQHLRHDYGYTLELLSVPVADPLAHFLFVRKKGHCEYFASAMAVMLRTLGHSVARGDRIPERRLQPHHRLASGARLRRA